MANFFKFYCLCLKDAWRGSIEKANAWAAIIGATIIWVGLWAWGYQLNPPETFGEGIFLTVFCLAAAWVALFVVRVISAAPRLYTKLEDENKTLLAKVITTEQAAERQGRRAVLNKLRYLYVTSHDEVPLEMNSGLMPLPKEWVESQLERLGLHWRQEEYW